MVSPATLSRIATLGILPLIGVAFWIGLRAQGAGGAGFEGEGILVVANLRDRSLSFGDLEGRLGSATIPLPGTPHEMLVVDGTLYVTLGRSDALVAVDVADRRVRQVLPMAGEPHGIATSGHSLFVTLDAAGEVVELTLPALVETGRLPAGDTPHAIVSLDRRLVVTESRDDRVHQVSPPGASAPAGGMPESLAVVGPYLATADATSGTVSLFDGETLAQVTSIEAGGRPVRVAAFGETTLLVALGGSGELAVVDLERMRVERRVPAGVLVDGICVSPSGRFVAVVASGAETVTIVDSERWRAVATIAAPGGPGACLWIEAV